jgi:hypothetical protein
MKGKELQKSFSGEETYLALGKVLRALISLFVGLLRLID